MAPKKDKKPAPGGKPAKPGKVVIAPPPKPKKIPPPPACFSTEELFQFKEVFKLFDEDKKDLVMLGDIPVMLRTLGFNPKTAEVEELFRLFLEDDLVDTVELHEWYFMIEAKMNWGDDFESVVTKAFAVLAHDEEETGTCDFLKLREELQTWGEPLLDIEFLPMIKLASKDKTYNKEEETICYEKFIENMNKIDNDTRFIKEPINYFKLDQKTLAELAMKKAQEEREAQEKKEAEARAREEARRQKMILDGLINA